MRSGSLEAGELPASTQQWNDTFSLPKWVVFHVPHDSTWIPPSARNQFLLNDAELKAELLRMTDHWTFDLFARGIPEEQVMRAEVSRLVVDVERFEDDAEESMSAFGMGAVYERTSDGRRLRRKLSPGERQNLMDVWYHAHHAMLEDAAQTAISDHGRALILDAHSFPSKPLPYELDQRLDRPDVCIGTDDFHTPKEFEEAFVHAFRDAGFTVGLNAPFAGTLVPMHYYRKDRRVTALMIEVNRGIYIDEATAERRPCFDSVAQSIRQCVARVISDCRIADRDE